MVVTYYGVVESKVVIKITDIFIREKYLKNVDKVIHILYGLCI